MSDKVKALRLRDSDEAAVDLALGRADIRFAATFVETRADALLRQLQQCTGIDSRRWRRLVCPHIGLPADSHLVDMLRSSLLGWLPAIVAGYNVCDIDSSDFSAIPQTVLVHNRGPDDTPGRWLYLLEVVCGPLRGQRIPLSVSDRLAATMLYRSAGLRIFKHLPRLRPYDMHRLHVLAGLQRCNGAILLRKVYKPAAPLTQNRLRIRQYLGKCRLNPMQNCFDCGRSASECPLSRHDSTPPTGECRVCGRTKYRLNVKGVCTSCVQNHLTTGVQLSVKLQYCPELTL